MSEHKATACDEFTRRTKASNEIIFERKISYGSLWSHALFTRMKQLCCVRLQGRNRSANRASERTSGIEWLTEHAGDNNHNGNNNSNNIHFISDCKPCKM